MLGMPALALTDHDARLRRGALCRAAAGRGDPADPRRGADARGRAHLTLLVEDETRLGNLCCADQPARAERPKGQRAAADGRAGEHTGRPDRALRLPPGRGCGALLRREQQAPALGRPGFRDLVRAGPFLHRAAAPSAARRRAARSGAGRAGARRRRLGVAATNNVHYATRERHRLQDVLVCIRHLTLDRPGTCAAPTPSTTSNPPPRWPRFRRISRGAGQHAPLAERCQFALRYGLQDLPAFPAPGGASGAALCARLCRAGVCRAAIPRRPSGASSSWTTSWRSSSSGLANYFLIVWDIVRFAREQGIRCQGRGSAANSLVAYLLGITPIDPLAP